MSVNSSSNSSLPSLQYNCSVDSTSMSIFTVYIFTCCTLLLPLIFLVLYVGYKKWRKKHSVATTANMSHFDIFTFNMVVMELIGVLGSFFLCGGIYTKGQSLAEVGVYFFSFVSYGQTLFHLLTCVEGYLAVVHPVTYLGLRQRGGVRIRNMSIVCVRLLCFGSLIFILYADHLKLIYGYLLLGFCIIVVSFCNLSVLCVLIRPGPGEEGRNRERVDQSKLRAFHTIMAIMGALLLRFLSLLVSSAMYSSSVLSFSEICLLGASLVWFSLPSSLVLPLLFLHRAGKLPGCKHNTESG